MKKALILLVSIFFFSACLSEKEEILPSEEAHQEIKEENTPASHKDPFSEPLEQAEFLTEKENLETQIEQTCILELEIVHDRKLENAIGTQDIAEAISPENIESMLIRLYERKEAIQSNFGLEENITGFNVENGKLVVNKNYFSDLSIRRANYGNEQYEAIGTYKDLTFSEQLPRDVAISLLQSGVIKTYSHLDADICLTLETETEEYYALEFIGTEFLCTSECYSEDYSFSVTIDKENGDIILYRDKVVEGI